MSFVALLWLLIERGGSPTDVGWLAAVYTAPVIVGGLAAGVILDAFDPRKVVAADNAIRGVAMASVPLAAALGVLTTVHLFVVAAIYGLLFMTSAAGIPSLITRLVSPEERTTANSMESLSFSLPGLVGPGVAGLLIAIVGAPFVLAVDALTYVIFVACLLLMREGGNESRATVVADAGDEAPTAVAAAAPAPSASPKSGRGLGPAVRFILRTPAIVAITVFYMSVNVAGGILIVVVPLYVRDVLHSGPELYGLLLSVLTAGELIGLLVVGAVSWRWPLGRSIAWSLLVSGVVIAPWILSPSELELAALLFIWGATGSSLTPWAQTIRMRLIPSEMRGRVFALLRTSMQSTRPVGSVVAGLLLSTGGLTVAIGAISLLFVVPGLVGIVLPALGRGPTAEPDRSGGAIEGTPEAVSR